MFEYGFPSLSQIRKYGLLEMPPPVGVSKINSCQNGLLLRADVHREFDQYLVSINPDVGLRSQVWLQ